MAGGLMSLELSLEWVKVITPTQEPGNFVLQRLTRNMRDNVAVVAFVNGKVPIILPHDDGHPGGSGGVFIWPKEPTRPGQPAEAATISLGKDDQAPTWFEGNGAQRKQHGQRQTMLKVMPDPSGRISLDAVITLWEIDSGPLQDIIDRVLEEAARYVPMPVLPVGAPAGLVTDVINLVPNFAKWLLNAITGYRDDFMDTRVLRLREEAWDCTPALIDYPWETEWEKEALSTHAVRFKSLVRAHDGVWELAVRVDRVCSGEVTVVDPPHEEPLEDPTPEPSEEPSGEVAPHSHGTLGTGPTPTP